MSHINPFTGNLEHELHTIKSWDDCSEFLGWLQEHPTVNNIQGWHLLRHEENNRVFAFSSNGIYRDHYSDCAWMYSERRMLNDWIRTYKERNDEKRSC